jgi:methylase of polypeptide subunit release factors
MKQKAWLTPVEIFKPVYAEAVLSWILRTRHNNNNNKKGDGVSGNDSDSATKSDALHIIEIGGGSGTLADGILTALQRDHPLIYHTCTYTVIDLSLPFVTHQRQRLAHHGQRFQSVGITSSQ